MATSNLDLALASTTSRDIALDGDDLALFAGAALVQQRLVVGHRLFRGEDYLDEEAGMPYFAQVLVNAPKSSTIEALFRQDILGDGDVQSLTSFQMTIDRAARKLSVAYEAVSSEGEIEVSEVFP